MHRSPVAAPLFGSLLCPKGPALHPRDPLCPARAPLGPPRVRTPTSPTSPDIHSTALRCCPCVALGTARQTWHALALRHGMRLRSGMACTRAQAWHALALRHGMHSRSGMACTCSQAWHALALRHGMHSRSGMACTRAQAWHACTHIQTRHALYSGADRDEFWHGQAEALEEKGGGVHGDALSRGSQQAHPPHMRSRGYRPEGSLN